MKCNGKKWLRRVAKVPKDLFNPSRRVELPPEMPQLYKTLPASLNIAFITHQHGRIILRLRIADLLIPTSVGSTPGAGSSHISNAMSWQCASLSVNSFWFNINVTNGTGLNWAAREIAINLIWHPKKDSLNFIKVNVCYLSSCYQF